MNFPEAANFLFDLRQFRPKPGTESTRDLLAALGDPHEALDCIQVAGSNGKGSTARMTESVLREAGYRVGLYTSPHFDDVRERFRVNGRKIPKAAVTSFVDEIREYVTAQAAAGQPTTFFEVTTAMALWHFAREEVDIAVLEVGIGGRFDATSVVTPVASAVTTVSLEHTELLGETIEEIAKDKAHVAPLGTPLVTGARGPALEAIKKQCLSLHAADGSDVPPEEQVRTVGSTDTDVTVTYKCRCNHQEAAILIDDLEVRIPLLGAHQATNAGIAATLARQVRPVDDESIASGLRAATWPGRFEIMAQDPLVVLDGAHNPGACEGLADVLETFAFDRLHLVIGAMHEKDHAGMATALPTADRVYACRPVPDRAEDPATLANVFEATGNGTVEEFPAVGDALVAALRDADPADCVLVAGSLYVVAEARQHWVRTTIPKDVRTVAAAEHALVSADLQPSEAATGHKHTIHRVAKTRVQQRQARWLEEEIRASGGAGFRAGLEDHIEENLDLVLAGTAAEYDALLGAMGGGPHGLEAIRPQLADTIGRSGPPGVGYPWCEEPVIMGVLNVTPDSFHDGGRYDEVSAAVERAHEQIADGAAIVDIGGESTRPGADPVENSVERDRVVPVIERLADAEVMVSVDTRKATVARAALEAGADMINDVSGLRDPEMRFVAAEFDVPVVVMHSINTPVVPERTTEYDDVVEDVIDELAERVLLAEKAGLDRSQIIVDPGLGFGKRAPDSFELLGRTGELAGLGCPIMVGHSHKSMWELIGCGPDERLPPTVAGTSIAVAAGADVVRVHDVAPNVAALRAAVRAGRRVR